MHVFMTGSSGFVGTAVVRELLGAGHSVTGLARSDASAAKLEAAGVTVVRGSLEDLNILRGAAAAADAVVHTAFNHDFSKFAENAVVERHAIEALGDAVAQKQRPLIVTSGLALIAPGRTVTEDDVRDPSAPFPRDPEGVAFAAAERGARVSIVRLPPSVHGEGDRHGFVPITIGAARQHGRSAYIDEGTNRWPAVHRLDAARLYLLALECAADRAIYHATGDDGVPFHEIATAIGHGLSLPATSITPGEADAHFGWFARFAQIDAPASSVKTQRILGWKPRESGLLADLRSDLYFSS